MKILQSFLPFFIFRCLPCFLRYFTQDSEASSRNATDSKVDMHVYITEEKFDAFQANLKQDRYTQDDFPDYDYPRPCRISSPLEGEDTKSRFSVS